MEKEIYISKNGKWVRATKWDLFWRKLKYLFTRWKLVDTNKYFITPEKDRVKHFILTDKEYEEAKKLYKKDGTISYEFYPGGGIGWGVKIHVLKTDEIIDITDVGSW